MYINIIKAKVKPVNVPRWLTALSDEDLQFVKRFILASGSLKELAQEYGISYPTVRLRLDRLITKIGLADDPKNEDPFRLMMQCLVAEGQVSATVAKSIIREHERTSERRKENEQRMV